MSLLQSIAHGLDWLATPRSLPGRLEMETQRGKRFELEVVSFTIRMPVGSGVKLKLPVFVMLMPSGTSALPSSEDPSRPVPDQ